MRLRAAAAVALLLLAGCTSQPATHTEKVVERVPGACHEAFKHADAAIADLEKQRLLDGQEFLDADKRVLNSMDAYDAARKECLR